MATRSDLDDDDFSDLYKEYTGPPASITTNTQDKVKPSKKSHASSDEDEEPRDPNAVPTDFTSREAKVWEAKSKATERNWKKRKEEEMICKICGESGHFTQGCPSTLGANRKSQDFFERVPARDKAMRALFTEKVIQKIEKDIGCKIKMEEKFIIVSGKDRSILAKGVDAVHKMKEEGAKKGSSSSHMARSRSPERSPVGSRFTRSESQRSVPSPQNAPQFQQRFSRPDKVVEDRVREDLQKLSRGSPQAYGGNNIGARGRSSRSRSPARHHHYATTAGGGGNLYNSHGKSMVPYKNDGWDIERRGSDMQSTRKFEYPASQQTLEELEMEYKREAMDLGKIRDKEEDEENLKHREAVREMRENYMKKFAMLRDTHTKQWEEFLQLDVQRRQQEQQRTRQQTTGFGGYKQSSYSEYDSPSAANPHYGGGGANLGMDLRGGYPHPMENYSSRSHDGYGEFQRQRRDDLGKTYNRY